MGGNPVDVEELKSALVENRKEDRKGSHSLLKLELLCGLLAVLLLVLDPELRQSRLVAAIIAGCMGVVFVALLASYYRLFRCERRLLLVQSLKALEGRDPTMQRVLFLELLEVDWDHKTLKTLCGVGSRRVNPEPQTSSMDHSPGRDSKHPEAKQEGGGHGKDTPSSAPIAASPPDNGSHCDAAR